jgi:outer membrane murein-binding lipoprotein Lpp
MIWLLSWLPWLAVAFLIAYLLSSLLEDRKRIANLESDLSSLNSEVNQLKSEMDAATSDSSDTGDMQSKPGR